VRIRFIDDILLLIITNFIVWSWALEKHPEPERDEYVKRVLFEDYSEEV
jgi:hypothetical protein